MRQSKLFLGILLLVVLILGGCSQPGPAPAPAPEVAPGEEERPGIRPPLPVEPEDEPLEGIYLGFMHTGGGLRIGGLAAKFEPVKPGQFEGFACFVSASDGERACNFIEVGLLVGDAVSFRLGSLRFSGKRIGEVLDLSFYVPDDPLLVGTIIMQPSEEDMPEEIDETAIFSSVVEGGTDVPPHYEDLGRIIKD